MGAGASFQVADRICFDALDTVEEEFAKQVMIAIPAPLRIETGEKQILFFQAFQDRLRILHVRHSIAGGSVHLLKYGSSEQKLLDVIRQPPEHLVRKVLEDELLRATQTGKHQVHILHIASVQ